MSGFRAIGYDILPFTEAEALEAPLTFRTDPVVIIYREAVSRWRDHCLRVRVRNGVAESAVADVPEPAEPPTAGRGAWDGKPEDGLPGPPQARPAKAGPPGRTNAPVWVISASMTVVGNIGFPAQRSNGLPGAAEDLALKRELFTRFSLQIDERALPLRGHAPLTRMGRVYVVAPRSSAEKRPRNRHRQGHGPQARSAASLGVRRHHAAFNGRRTPSPPRAPGGRLRGRAVPCSGNRDSEELFRVRRAISLWPRLRLMPTRLFDARLCDYQQVPRACDQ